MAQKEGYLDFDMYLRQGEPSQRETAFAWSTAIGLQAVDGLKTSMYLQETARRNIVGEITIDEARTLVNQYYVTKTAHDNNDADKEEADRVSSNIVKVLASRTFDFSTGGYQSIHRRVFEGVMKHAGELRKYDITKKEWILEGDTVLYLNWEDLRRAIDYDLEQERAFSYVGITTDEMISHLTQFVSGLWQIHAFPEGNTRTTAVFVIQYLRSLGFNVDNDLFAKHSWYFRNALVRANYHNIAKGIDYSPVFLERFFRNLLLGERWVLRNRYLHIHPRKEWCVQPNLSSTSEVQVETVSTSTEHTQDGSATLGDDYPSMKYPTSTRQVPDKLHTENPNIIKLVQVIDKQQVSVKEMMSIVGLKDRENFLNLYLAPAISEGFVCLLYPHSPRHPRQRYLLTVKGIALYNELLNKSSAQQPPEC